MPASRCCSCWSSASWRAPRSGPAESLLTMSGNQNICAVVYALTLALNIALSVVLIPAFGLWGAAIATAVVDGVRGGRAVLHRLAQARHRHGDLRCPAEEAALMAAVPLARGDERQPVRRHDRRARRPRRRRIGDPAHIELLESRRPVRRLAIYPASAGFDMVEELDYLCARTIEPNVFFNPRFLAPAMPRLEDREVRLAVIRDGDEYKNRLRLLVPFSVERPGHAARRLDHADMVEPVRPARHAAASTATIRPASSRISSTCCRGRISSCPRSWCCRTCGSTAPVASHAGKRRRNRAACRW